MTEDLVQSVNHLLEDIREAASVKESLEWYLSNNLLKFRDAFSKPATAEERKLAVHMLDRFCVDSMDWDSKLFKMCTMITEVGRALAKSTAPSL